MKDFLQHYEMKITALAPIHVGDGREISKKEYIQYGQKSAVMIPDQNKMFRDLCMMHKDRSFGEYMLSNSRDGLSGWLRDQRIDRDKVLSWTRYQMDPGDAFVKASNGRSATPKGIKVFTKDAYDMPYVPGSTLKGMLRTALLAAIVKSDIHHYSSELNAIRQADLQRARRKTAMQRETASLEAAAFHTLRRNEKRLGDAVNSVMSGLIVSDSEPIGLDRLILSQKIDYTLKGVENPLPILREALSPGTEIRFTITIDQSVFPYTIEDILDALNGFQEDSYRYFYQRFGRGRQGDGIVWLGGGTGFLSKTVLYPILGEDAVRVTDRIFRATIDGKGYEMHKHYNDVNLGIAPHVCKCTRYQGKLYDMGMGKIEVIS